MAAKTIAESNAVLNTNLVGTNYVALLTAASSVPNGTVTEVSGGSYARQASTWTSASGGSSSNVPTLTFSSLPACTVTYFAVYSAATGGSIIYCGPLTASQTVGAGNGLAFNPGSLICSES